MSGLQVSALSLRFGDTAALDGLDLVVAPGEIIAVVGPSGCGKSSLLRSIAGLEPSATGSVSWNGHTLDDTPTHRRGFGLMFQHHALFPHRTVAENIGFGLRMQHVDASERQARIQQLLELVELTGYDHRLPDTLSGGEAQRVALARSLAPEPGLLLLDEPLGSLDRHLRDQLVVQLRDILTRLGQTAVHVTHDLDEAYAIADRVAVMHQGRILRIATPTDLWTDPRHEFVARFVGHTAFTERNGERVVIRSDACARADDGEEATVLSTAFLGDRTAIVAELTSDGTRLTLHDAHAPTIGQTIHVAIDPAGICKLSTEQ